MSDFSPEVRNNALWSNDARRFVEGRSGEVYAEKIGVKPLDDLSNVEAVQMGSVRSMATMVQLMLTQATVFNACMNP